MTVSELILWVDRAIDAREKSWQSPSKEVQERSEGLIPGKYTLTDDEALRLTIIGETKPYETEIASMLMQWGNDITTWKEQIDKDNSFNFSLVDRNP